jgi:hypothetical protein
MPKIKYIEKTFQPKSLRLIEQANRVIDDYRARGYELTLRQLYYQLVAKDLIPNNEKTYKKLGNTISQARDAGLVDWYAIVDRTRGSSGLTFWSGPSEIIRAAANGYRVDKWQEQDYRVFVWVEKEALAGVVSRACATNSVQVEYLSCRGYMSASTIWREGQNIIEVIANGQTPVFLHLGDHDPSGIDMTRDNIERLELYSEEREGVGFIFRRLALNWAQVEQYSPPPNPAKLTDSRINGYIDKFGRQSWELDALDPDILVDLIRSTIDEYRDRDRWEKWVKVENEERARLEEVADTWECE